MALRGCAAALTDLATAIDAARLEQDRREFSPQSASSWPDIMSTRLATRYCGFKTTAALRKARLEGKIRAAGKRGGAGSWTWARSDLDAFMRGKREGWVPEASEQPRDAVVPAPTGRNSGARGARSGARDGLARMQGPATRAALERLRAMKWKK